MVVFNFFYFKKLLKIYALYVKIVLKIEYFKGETINE